MARSAVLAIRIIADAAQARREMDSTGRAAGKFGRGLSKATGPATAVIGGIALLAKEAGQAASELQQSSGGVASVFGKYAGAITKNAKAAATAVGLSQTAYQNQAVLMGSQLKNLGVPMDKVAGQTQGLIKKASDLAATFGGSTADAVEAIGSLMRGESDPIERYGVSINQAAIKAYELSHGLKTTTQAQATNSKRIALMALLYKQTSSATGQFARETNTAAGASEIAAAQYENSKAALGTKLLPVMAKFRSILGSVAGFVTRNSTLVFALVGVIGGLAAAVLIINGAFRAWTAITRAFTIVQALFNAVLAANPLILIAALVIALGVALVVAYKKSETFRAIVQAAFAAVMSVVRPFVSFFTTTIPAAFMAVVTGLHTAWTAVVGFIRTWGPRALIFLAPFIGIPLLIYRHFSQIVGFLSRVWSSVYRTVSSFVQTVVGAVVGIPGRLGRAAGSFLSAGVRLIGAFFRGIGNAVKGVGSFAANIAQSIVNTLIRGINSALNLPWTLKFHIPIPFAPDINVGPYTLLPSIPLWAAVPPAPSLDTLMPGFTLLAASAGWASAPVASASSSSSSPASVVIQATFPGLVTDPEAVARQIKGLARDSAVRNGLTRVAV